MKEKTPYRIFICYAHEDEALAKDIFHHLKNDERLEPILDQVFIPGRRFREQIKNSIAHAHVFVPLLTPLSIKRGWVHQEIGFATAFNIPILPICKGSLPPGLIDEFQCIKWEERHSHVAQYLSWEHIDLLVHSAQEESPPLYECAELHSQRTKMMVDYAQGVLHLKYYGHVRQKGALSSFHIPNKPTYDHAWQERYGHSPKDEQLCRLLRKECQALTEHATREGFSLIIDPDLDFSWYGPGARPARLRSLLEFFQSVRGDNVKMRVAIDTAMPKEEHLTIVGDWFLAESVSASIGRGYQQTIFTRHAPTILTRIESFDEEINSLFSDQGVIPESSLDWAIEEIKGRLLKKNR